MTEKLADLENNTIVEDKQSTPVKSKRKYTKKTKTENATVHNDEVAQLKELVLALSNQISQLKNNKDTPSANSATDGVRRYNPSTDESLKPIRKTSNDVRRARNSEHVGTQECKRQSINLGNRPNEFEKIITDTRFKQAVDAEYKAGGLVEPKYAPPTPRREQVQLDKVECMRCFAICEVPSDLIPMDNRFLCNNCVPKKS